MEDHGVFKGTLRAGTRNGMPVPAGYVYRGGGGRLLHGTRCPDCGGKVRLQAGSVRLGVCAGCRGLVELAVD